MRDYKYLEELNLEEVAKNTQIEISCLKWIVNKDFSRLRKFNLRGFAKILAREYGIDMASFLEEFEQYLAENEPKRYANVVVTPRMESYAPKSSKFWLWLIAIAAIIALASYLNLFSFIYDLKDDLSSNSNNASVQIAQANVKNLESKSKLAGIDLNSSKQAFLETKSILADANESSTLQAKQIDKEVNTQVNKEAKNTLIISKDDGASKQKASLMDLDKEALQDGENPIKADDKKEADSNKADVITADKKDSTKSQASMDSSKAKFIIKEKFWIGTIILKTHSKSSRVVDKDFTLDLSSPMLITTGHAPFSILYKGVNKSYKGGYTKYFYFDGKSLQRIKRKEFLAKNKGRLW